MLAPRMLAPLMFSEPALCNPRMSAVFAQTPETTVPAARRRPEPRASVELHWLSLGARGNFVRVGGKVYEAVAAVLDRRSTHDIYHSVLNVGVPHGRFVIEMGPVADGNGAGRGVVVEGPVESWLVARFRLFRYEVRCWRDGITAYAYAVDSPRRILTIPKEPSKCSNWFTKGRHSPGVATNFEPARCGPATPSLPGS
jgi:hypothetical protein